MKSISCQLKSNAPIEIRSIKNSSENQRHPPEGLALLSRDRMEDK